MRHLKYTDLRASVFNFLQAHGLTMAIYAMAYGESKHVGLRKDKRTPEFQHQLTQAEFLRSMLFGIEQNHHDRHVHVILNVLFSTIALHDVVEDIDDVTIEMIIEKFGEMVGETVQLMTKTGKLVTHADHAAYYDPMIGHEVVALTKGIDRIHNLQSMGDGVFSPKKMATYVKETRDWIVPMIEKTIAMNVRTNVLLQHVLMTLNMQLELVEDTLRVHTKLVVLELMHLAGTAKTQSDSYRKKVETLVELAPHTPATDPLAEVIHAILLKANA